MTKKKKNETAGVEGKDEEKKEAEGSGDQDRIVTEPITEFLKYTFSEAEKTEMGAKLAQCFSDCSGAEAQLKSVQTQIKSEIARIEAEMGSLSEKIRSGYEHRNVECEKVFDFRLGSVTYRRLDTGEVYRERAMDETEKQTSMNFEHKETEEQEEAAA